LEISPGYSVQHEFAGFGGVFSVDSGVYLDDKLVAFVEIDGEFHYRQFDRQLCRKDQMKEYLYRLKFPGIPLYRIRGDQCAAIGDRNAGAALASWISKLTTR